MSVLEGYGVLTKLAQNQGNAFIIVVEKCLARYIFLLYSMYWL